MASVCRICRTLHCRRENFSRCGISIFAAKQVYKGGFDRELNTSPLRRGYPLPWIHHSKPFVLREPIWNRQTGLFLLRRVANMHGQQFSVSDFLLGARDAVYTLADVMACQDNHDQLQELLQPALCSAMEESLGNLPQNAHIHLDIESIRGLQLTSVNAVVGSAEPGDEHVMAWLGHKVITSEAKMQKLVTQDTKFTLDSAKEIGQMAVATRLEFLLGVTFNTKEKFAVLDEGGQLVEGSNQFRDCFHFWRFSSLVEWETDEYPFQWSIVDINNYVRLNVV